VHCPPNTRHGLRATRSRTTVHGGSTTALPAAYHASLRLQPPLVSIIALSGANHFILALHETAPKRLGRNVTK
jgi:hypothetical protein